MYTHLIKKQLFYMNALSPIYSWVKGNLGRYKLVDYITHLCNKFHLNWKYYGFQNTRCLSPSRNFLSRIVISSVYYE